MGADQHRQRRDADGGHGARASQTLVVSHPRARIDDRPSDVAVRPEEESPPRWHLWGFWGLVALAYGLVGAGFWALWHLLGG